MRTAACLVTLLLLAGCSNAKDQEDGTSTGEASGNEPLSGFVFDAAIQPIAGANVSIPSLGVATTTNEKGRYGFAELPYDASMTVITQADGFQPTSKSLQVVQGTAMHVNFTLERVPVKTPFHDTDSFQGIINCNGVAKAEGERHEIPCGLVAQGLGVDNRVWEFQVDPELTGLVVELFWKQDTEFARHLNLTIETMGFGDQDKVIFSEEGESVLRGQIGAFDARRFYSGGGMVRVAVDIGRNTAADEVNAGVGFAAQQTFEVFATEFYVAPPPPSFTIDDSR